MWAWASSFSGTRARGLVEPKVEYPRTQQEHRLSGTTVDDRQLHRCSFRTRSTAHRWRTESGSSGPSWPPLAALVRGLRSPSQPGSRTPSGGDARWLPASCGTQEETQMWCCTDGRWNGARHWEIFMDHRAALMKVVAKDDCPVPVSRPHRHLYTHRPH